MNVAELIEWLKTQDQEAIVEVLHSYEKNWGGSTYITSERVEFDPTKHADYMDFRGNRFVKPHEPWYEKRELFLGDDEGNG